MTPIRPVGAGTPDPLDLAAADQLEANESRRLALVRARAEKWIGAISALGGLLGTVLVVKGRDTVTQIPPTWRVASALTLAAALILLAFGTYRAYQAAFGEPGALAEISPDPLTGLHRRLLSAQRTAAVTAQRHLAEALKAVLAAIGLIATGVALTWFAPAATTRSPAKATCIYSAGKLVVRLSAASVAVSHSEPGATIGTCP